VPKINEEMREDLGLPTLDVELEAFFDYWLTADVKNRNFGIITWPEKKAGHLKVTGYEHKAANASPISKEVQEIAFRLIGAGSTEEEVYEALRPIVLSTFRKQKSVEEVAAFGRMGKAKYERVPPNAAKAMLYYNHNLSKEEPFLVNDQAQWVYVSGVPDDMPHTNVVAFREASDIDDFTVDYGLLVEKFIRNKLESIYDVLDWDIANLCEMGPKRYFL
jgi:DNA polymerase elongation subunit (family B)